MNIQLSEHFTYKKLLRFILPSIIMMVFTSIYSVVDGIFVSNFVGKSAFASVNLIMPYLMGISALGFMIGTGGSAFVSNTLYIIHILKKIKFFSQSRNLKRIKATKCISILHTGFQFGCQCFHTFQFPFPHFQKIVSSG